MRDDISLFYLKTYFYLGVIATSTAYQPSKWIIVCRIALLRALLDFANGNAPVGIFRRTLASPEAVFAPCELLQAVHPLRCSQSSLRHDYQKEAFLKYD